MKPVLCLGTLSGQTQTGNFLVRACSVLPICSCCALPPTEYSAQFKEADRRCFLHDLLGTEQGHRYLSFVNSANGRD